MKTIVLDSNELVRDWMLTGLKYQLFDHMHHASWFTVYVPAVVLEELVAAYARAATKLEGAKAQLNRERRLLGLEPLQGAPATWDYRKYVEERFDERLAFNVLPWPETPHQELSMRAVNRTPPFNEKGTGYRDALVWADVVELARKGHDVAFVSMDRAFKGEDERLAPQLADEIEPLRGTVELVRDFNRWLITALPWKSVADLSAAVSISRTSEFYDWYLKSDFQDDLEPSIADIGFRWSPSKFEIDEVAWDGEFVPIEGGEVADIDGLTLSEYELGQTVTFKAEFSEGIEPEPGWYISQTDFMRSVHVEGEVKMVLRVAVLFGGEFGFTIEELAWRRADGLGPGAPIYRPESDSNQLRLFDDPAGG